MPLIDLPRHLLGQPTMKGTNMTVPTTIDLPGEGVSVTATCGRCHEPLARSAGSVSWRCDNTACSAFLIPMWEDARFVDDTGRRWIFTDDGEWIDVVDD